MRDMEVKTHAYQLPSGGNLPPPAKRAPPRERPKPLPFDVADAPDTYAMVCIGDCMEPIIANGTTLAFDKLAPCRPGDTVVVWKRPNLIRAGEPPAVVKRLVYPIPSFVTFPYVGHPDDEVRPVLAVEMLKPRKVFWVGCEEVVAVHRCLGAVERLSSGETAVREQLISDIRLGRV